MKAYAVLTISVLGFTAEPDAWLEQITAANRARLAGDLASAEKQYLAALELARQLGENHTRYGQTLHNFAGVYQAKRDYVRAEELMLRSVAIQEKVLGRAHPNIAVSMTNLGDLYGDMNRFDDAEKAYRTAIRIGEQQPAKAQGQLAIALTDLGELYYCADRMKSAEISLSRALPIAERIFGPDHHRTVRILLFLGNAEYAAAKYSDAEVAWRRALSAESRRSKPDSSTASTLRMNLGELKRFERNYAESESMLLSAIAGLEQAADPLLPSAFNHLALVYAEQDRTADAESLYLRALAVLKDANEALPNRQRAVILHNFARLRQKQLRPAEAAVFFVRALESAEAVLGPGGVWLKALLSDYAKLLRSLHRNREASRLEQRARGIASFAPRETVDIRELRRQQ